jgi:hypothetical protein
MPERSSMLKAVGGEVTKWTEIITCLKMSATASYNKFQIKKCQYYVR